MFLVASALIVVDFLQYLAAQLAISTFAALTHLFILDSEVGVLWLFRGVCVGCVQIFVTFSAVFGVAVYRICMLSVWSMNPDPEAKASVRMTVTTTGIILNMLVVLVLEEVYGAIAVWLTELGDVWKTGSVKNPTAFGHIHIGNCCFYSVSVCWMSVFPEQTCLMFVVSLSNRTSKDNRGVWRATDC